MSFDPVFSSATSPQHTGTFHAHPRFHLERLGNAFDIAVIVLDEPVLNVTPARLPTAGLLDQMKAAKELTKETQLTSVGYGAYEIVMEPGGHQASYDRARRHAVGTFTGLGSAFLHLGQSSGAGNGGTCSGDSGGPNFLGAGVAETNVIAGITSTGDTWCKATNVDLRMDTETSRQFLAAFVTLP